MAFIPSLTRLPFRPPSSTSIGSRRGTLMCTASVPRRHVLRLATLALGVTMLPGASKSFSLNDLTLSGTLEAIALGRTKAKALKNVATTWKTCTEDEKLLVLRFIPIWLEPARVASAKLPDLLRSKNVDIESLRGQANAMFGHLLELRSEAKAFSTEGIIRELDEVVETVDAIFDITKKAGIA